MAKPVTGLEKKLKSLDPQVKKYVSGLQKENGRLELQIANMKLKEKALNLRIKALEKGEISDLGERLRRAREREDAAELLGSAKELLGKIHPTPSGAKSGGGAN